MKKNNWNQLSLTIHLKITPNGSSTGWNVSKPYASTLARANGGRYGKVKISLFLYDL